MSRQVNIWKNVSSALKVVESCLWVTYGLVCEFCGWPGREVLDEPKIGRTHRVHGKKSGGTEARPSA
jgi:hypothetical protein